MIVGEVFNMLTPITDIKNLKLKIGGSPSQRSGHILMSGELNETCKCVIDSPARL
jgi:hypothetical protein